MIGGAPPDAKIVVTRAAVITQLNRFEQSIHPEIRKRKDWRSFYAGQLCVVNNNMDKELKRFGVEVEDD